MLSTPPKLFNSCTSRGEIRRNLISLSISTYLYQKSIEIARTSRTILGANGITGEYPIMRHAAKLESVLTYEGTSVIHLLTIGRALTGISAFR